MNEEWLHQNASGGGSIHKTREDAEAAMREWEARRAGTLWVDHPPPPPSLGIFRRTVSEWIEVSR